MTKYTLRDRWSLVEHLFFLIGLTWDPADEAPRPDPGTDPDVGTQAEEFFLGRRCVNTRDLFVGILGALVAQIEFRQAPQGSGGLDHGLKIYQGLSNRDRWRELYALCAEIERDWDEELLVHYNINTSFSEVLHLLAGIELFKDP